MTAIAAVIIFSSPWTEIPAVDFYQVIIDRAMAPPVEMFPAFIAIGQRQAG